MNAAIAVQLLLGLLQQSQAIGNLIATAQAAGRDITDAELDSLVSADEAAKAALAAAIAAARATSPAAPVAPAAPVVPPVAPPAA